MNIETIEKDPLLSDCVERLMCEKKEADKERTAGNYQSAWNKFAAFLGPRAAEFRLSDLDSNIAKQYRIWLLQDEASGNDQLKRGSQNFYLRNLKAIYNRIKKDPHFSLPAGNPFEGVHIAVPPTRKRALSKQKIGMLTRLTLYKISELPEFTNRPGRMDALQLALFLFYARGMCFIDVFLLEHENVKDEYIHYIRSKTGVALQVKITPEMRTIMQKYQERNSRWVFPFLHEKMIGKGHLTPQSSLHRINTYLKEVGETLKLPIPFTTYVMRHSWASMMLEADSEISVISQSMRHTSLQTTEIYLGQLSIAKMDKASDNMLDHLLRKPQQRKKELETEPLRIVPTIAVTAPKLSFIDKCKNRVKAITSKIQLFLM
ncbi:MAG: site-specific integrase [Parabacteroides sp.]|nr:site-specific integrase [Parabacteroides sp.]